MAISIAPGSLPATKRSQWHPADKSVSFQWFPGKTSRTPHYGEEWLFHARITAPPPTPQNRPAPPATTASAYVGRFLRAGCGNLLTAKCLEARAEAARVLSIGITDYPDAVKTMNSLLLGYRSQMPQEPYRAYASTGTIHIFAMDGFHVVVQAAVIIFALGACRIPRTRWILFLAPMLVALHGHDRSSTKRSQGMRHGHHLLVGAASRTKKRRLYGPRRIRNTHPRLCPGRPPEARFHSFIRGRPGDRASLSGVRATSAEAFRAGPFAPSA